MTGFVSFLFYLSAAILALILVLTANNMSKATCGCMKVCLFLIGIGMLGLLIAVHYQLPSWLGVLCLLPILWGITGWLIFDRYRAHEDLARMRDRVLATIATIKRIFKPRGRTYEA